MLFVRVSVRAILMFLSFCVIRTYKIKEQGIQMNCTEQDRP